MPINNKVLTIIQGISYPSFRPLSTIRRASISEEFNRLLKPNAKEREKTTISSTQCIRSTIIMSEWRRLCRPVGWSDVYMKYLDSRRKRDFGTLGLAAQFCFDIARPGIGKDQVFDAFECCVKDSVVEVAGHDTAAARGA